MRKQPKIIGWRTILLEFYYWLNFLAVLIVGIFAWKQRIPHFQIIPIVVLGFSIVLIPKSGPRFFLGHAILLLFPITIWYNDYRFQQALACWLPILINLFFAYLGKPVLKSADIIRFNIFSIFHLFVLGGIFLINSHKEFGLDLIGILPNAFTPLILSIAIKLSKENQELSQKNKEFSEGLKRVVSSVIHDMSRWTSMASLGLKLSHGISDQLHRFIHEGVDGMHELAKRIKQIIKVDQFVFFDHVNLVEFLIEVKAKAEAILPMKVQYISSQESIRVRIDKKILSDALLNLVQNAAKAESKRFEVLILDNEEDIRLEIKDDGKGFPISIVDNIFRDIVPSGNGGTGSGLLTMKFTLGFMDAKLRIIDYNHGGLGLTRILISNLISENKKNNESIATSAGPFLKSIQNFIHRR